MKLEQQVCSLDLAKRLKELGVKQESYFYWLRKGEYYSGVEHYDASEPFLSEESPPYDFPYEQVASAFTVAELGEMLPASMTQTFKVHKSASDENWFWECEVDTLLDKEGKYFSADTEADARAKMLIYLLENNLITL